MRLKLLQTMLSVLIFLTSFSALAADEQGKAVPRFDINGYTVEGNTLLPSAVLDSILLPFTGKERDFGAVQEALEALENNYRERGFCMVSVALPEQELDRGVVLLKVSENHLGKINIRGNRYFDEGNILRSLPSLHAGESPDLRSVSRSLKIANENNAKQITMQLVNSDREEVIDADITVKDESPWRAGFTFDNTGERQTGTTRLGVLLQHANVFNRDHLLTLQYITSPEKPDKVRIYSFGYRMPLYALGSSIDLIGAYSNVDSGTISAVSLPMDVSGKGTIIGIHYNQILNRIGNYEHRLTLGLDYRAYENSVNLFGIELGNNVTVHPVSLTYAGSMMVEDKMQAGFYLTDMQNLPFGWGGRDGVEDFDKARGGAPRGYNMFRYGANFSYLPGADWQIRLLFNGQHTGDRLVPGEQYGIGGAQTVRGFSERAYASDRGYAGSAEIYTPDLGRIFGIKELQTRLLFFYDRGYIDRNDPLPGEVVSTQIASVGPGLRITYGKRLSVSLDCGFVVDPPDEGTSRGSSVWHLSASLLF